MIDKAVIPAAGLGTRLLPATKEQPKEMLPVYSRAPNGEVCLKPILQLIYEQLYDLGLREFCLVIGRGKRAIQDHFTQDYSYAIHLRNMERMPAAEDLEAFYRRLDDSVISWIMQPEPLGFGDAVLRTRRAVGDSDFLVHAGDAFIVSRRNAYFSRLKTIFDQRRPSAVLLIHELTDPRQKGIAEVRQPDSDAYEVLSVAEKPEKPKTKLAIEPVYIFKAQLFEALEKIKPDRGGEVQLTDGIQQMIDDGKKVYATRLHEDEVRLDLGDADSYWQALAISHRLAKS